MKVKPSGGNPRGRGTYNPACDVCAKKKIKCDGNKPVCQPCRQQGREQECSWTKNPVRKPRTEQHFEAMHKRAEALRMRAVDWRKYADYLESLLDQFQQEYSHPRTLDFNFRATRPSDTDGLLGEVFDHDHDHDFEHSVLGSEDFDTSSDHGDLTKELCNPGPGLKLEENGLLHHYGNTAPFRFDHNAQPNPHPQPSRFPALAQNPDATYVLLTNDDPGDHYNPDFDWSRHLPSVVPLDRRSHDKALDLIFKFFTSWCLRVVPALFLRDMYRALSIPASLPVPKTPHYSPMLHNALIALGLAFLDDPKLRDLKSRTYFANKAKSYIEAECSKPNISVVNALSILASFHSSQGDQTLGYLYFGMSARVSQALGLTVDCSEWVKLGVMDDADLLDRRWTYWTIFTQDVCWSLYVGREFCITSPPNNTETFKAVSVPLVDLEFDQMPWDHPEAKLEPQPNYLTKTFEATCELLMIARRVMDVVNSLDKSRSRTAALDALISEIDLNLNTWKGRLSPELDITVKSRPTATPHKLMMHMAYWWLFILLHRPFFQKKARLIYTTDREIDHVKLCRRASENIMELLATWRSLYTLRYCPITLIQCVFSAGTVYLLNAVQASSGTRVAQKELRHSMDQQTLVLQYLQEIGKSWQCSTNIAGIMRNLMHEQLKPVLERKTIPISAAQNGALLLSDYGDDDDDDSHLTSNGRIRRHSSLTKPKHHRMAIHSRNHSVNNSSQPSPSMLPASLSPVITISPAQQDPPSFASSSSPPRSAPIAIRAPPIRDSSHSSASPSSFPSSFTDSWSLRSPNIPTSAAGSPSPSITGNPFYSSASNSMPGSAPSSFSQQYLTNPSANSLTYRTSPSAPLDELAFTGSGHTMSHLFETSGFGIYQDLGAPPSPSHTEHAYTTTEMSAFLGMPGGQTLSQAPSVMGLSFANLTLSPELGFVYEAMPQQSGSSFRGAGTAAGGAAEFMGYDAGVPAAKDVPPVDNDANMDDGLSWDWQQTLEF